MEYRWDSPLGPLFAYFYMAELENNIIPFLKPEESPLVCWRYVDDIFLIVNRKSTINLIKSKFEEASVLRFTYEIEKHNELTFLDVNITHKNNQIETSVHTKSTHSGDCINYHRIAPDRYKTGIIKSMLNRAYTIGSKGPSTLATLFIHRWPRLCGGPEHTRATCGGDMYDEPQPVAHLSHKLQCARQSLKIMVSNGNKYPRHKNAATCG